MNLERIRMIIISVLGFLLLMDAGLALYLFWPGGASGRTRRAEEQQLQQELAQKSKELAPLKGIDKKLVATRADIKKFYDDRVPEYWSQISSELHKLEQENGIPTQAYRYNTEDSGLPNLELVQVDTGVASDYVKIARFINALERDKYVFLIKQVSVVQQPAAGTVQFQIKFETFLKVA
jgi:Tfp pilus assembly protein PilO